MKKLLLILSTFKRHKTRIFFSIFALILTMTVLGFIICTIFSIDESKRSIQTTEEAKILTMEFNKGPIYKKEYRAGPIRQYFTKADIDNLEKSNFNIQWLPTYTNEVHVFRYSFLSQFRQINERNLRIYMVDPDYFQFFKINILQGRAFHVHDLNQTRVLIINDQLQRCLFGHDHQKNRVSINGNEYQIIGVADDYNKGFNMGLNIAKDELQTIYLLPPAGIYRSKMTGIFIKAPSNEEIESLANSLAKKIGIESNLGDRLIIHPFIETITKDLDEANRGAMVLLIFSIALLIGAEIGLFGTFQLFNKERSRNICIKMVYGGTPQDIVFEILFEFLIISLTGTIIGIALSNLLIILVNDILKPPMIIHNYLWINLVLLITVNIISLGLALYPAYQAAQSRPAQVLHEL